MSHQNKESSINVLQLSKHLNVLKYREKLTTPSGEAIVDHVVRKISIASKLIQAVTNTAQQREMICINVGYDGRKSFFETTNTNNQRTSKSADRIAVLNESDNLSLDWLKRNI